MIRRFLQNTTVDCVALWILKSSWNSTYFTPGLLAYWISCQCWPGPTLTKLHWASLWPLRRHTKVIARIFIHNWPENLSNGVSRMFQPLHGLWSQDWNDPDLLAWPPAADPGSHRSKGGIVTDLSVLYRGFGCLWAPPVTQHMYGVTEWSCRDFLNH